MRIWRAGGPSRRRLAEAKPRRLVATRDINHIETFVPAAGGAAGPPIDPPIIMLFTQTRDDRSWRAGGLAGLSRPATSIASKHLYLWLAGPQALHSL